MTRHRQATHVLRGALNYSISSVRKLYVLTFDPRVQYLAKHVMAIKFLSLKRCFVRSLHLFDLDRWTLVQIIGKACLSCNCFVFQIGHMIFGTWVHEGEGAILCFSYLKQFCLVIIQSIKSIHVTKIKVYILL